jgi:hypothetical protein
MSRHIPLQTYVPPLIARWIRDRAEEREVSVSIVVRDLLVAAWDHENEARDRPGGTDPARQRVFFTVALDALLMNHEDATLRDRTIAAYHRRLEKLGFIPTRNKEAGDEA